MPGPTRDKKKWLFFPFHNIDNDPSMPGNAQRYKAKYASRGLFDMMQWPTGDLSRVQFDEMLIIAGHGWHGKSSIGVNVLKPDNEVDPRETAARINHGKPAATKEETLSAHALADRIQKSGLRQNHVHIKLITCGGAGMAVLSQTDAARTAFPQNGIAFGDFAMTNCLAPVFAKEMGLLLYNNIMVRAYPGFLAADMIDKKLTVELPQGRPGRNLTHEVWDGADGFKMETYYENVAVIPTKHIAEKYWFNAGGDRVRDYGVPDQPCCVQ